MPPRPVTLEALRRFAVRRALPVPTTLGRAVARAGFVQVDPIRAPARAQDLILRHRVRDYRAGDLEARYARLDLEEDYFVNYGVLPTALANLMHPRTARVSWTRAQARKAAAVLEFVQTCGAAHPDDVDAHFAHGHARNWFGGRSRVSTQLLDAMHYRGLLRVVRRDRGIRVYGVRPAPPPLDAPDARLDTLLDLALACYAPLPAATAGQLASHLVRMGVPQWATRRRAALDRLVARAAQATVEGVRWLWPADEAPPRRAKDDLPRVVRLLAPFDPIVWDRRRFEQFWGWAYRFEAYTPAAKRVRGYYTLPLLWGTDVIGWASLQYADGVLQPTFGYVSGRAPDDPAFHRALEAELADLTRFLTPR